MTDEEELQQRIVVLEGEVAAERAALFERTGSELTTRELTEMIAPLEAEVAELEARFVELSAKEEKLSSYVQMLRDRVVRD